MKVKTKTIDLDKREMVEKEVDLDPTIINLGDLVEYLHPVTKRLHRLDGPAVIYSSGLKLWYVNGKLHREDGPAIEDPDRYRVWYVNGNIHREYGPAVERLNGTKEWYIDGKRHRLDGPAIEYCTGGKEWWLNGHQLTAKEVEIAFGGYLDEDN